MLYESISALWNKNNAHKKDKLKEKWSNICEKKNLTIVRSLACKLHNFIALHTTIASKSTAVTSTTVS